MSVEIKLRSIKGSALTHTEMDDNFKQLIHSSSISGATSDGSATITLFSSASANPSNTYGLGITFPYSGSALITGSLTVTGSANFKDNVTISQTGRLILAPDFEIYRPISGNSVIQEGGSGDLIIQSNNEVEIKSGELGETFAKFTKDGPIELYYDDVKKFETAPDGAIISGSLRVNGSGSFGSHLQAHCMGLNEAPSGIAGQLNATNVITTYLSSSGATYVSASFGSSSSLEVVMIDQSGQLFRTASSAVGTGGAVNNAFPYTGSAQITGSLGITGSFDTTNVQISGSLKPIVNDLDLGDSTTPWRDLYLRDSLSLNNLTISRTSYEANVTTLAFTGSNLLRYTTVGGTEVDVDLSSLTGSASSLALYSETGTAGTGTASIAGQLDVAGKVVAQEFHTEFVTSSVIFESGSTQFGNTIDDTHNFHGAVDVTGSFVVTGSVQATGDIIAYASSDERLKDNIELIPQPIDKLKQIKGVSFDWNNESEHTGHDIGVIAQDIEKILPELVATRDNGYKAVRYEKIVALLIEAIKDQQSQIDELKSKI